MNTDRDGRNQKLGDSLRLRVFVVKAGYQSTTKTQRITKSFRSVGSLSGGSKMKSRRDFLFDSYLGLGALALKDLLGGDFARAASGGDANPLAAKPQHHPAKAKSCIFLFMEGG